MSQKRTHRLEAANLLLAVHLLFYTIMWGIAIYGSVVGLSPNMYSYRNLAVVALLWLPVLALHSVLYLRTAARTTPDAERQAYREGFTDAMGRLADQSYDAHRLRLDDEGELVEFEGKRKRREG